MPSDPKASCKVTVIKKGGLVHTGNQDAQVRDAVMLCGRRKPQEVTAEDLSPRTAGLGSRAVVGGARGTRNEQKGEQGLGR